MRKKDFYKRNKSLILISVIFILFIVVGSCINKIDSSNLEDMSSQIGEIKSYYNGNISIKDFTITNIKEYIRYLGSIGIFTLLFFTFPISIIVFIVKAISIGYTINTSVLLLGLSSFKMCIIVLLKNIVIIPMSIILIELAISYIKNVYKQLKKKRQDSIVALGKEFVLNLVIIMCASCVDGMGGSHFEKLIVKGSVDEIDAYLSKIPPKETIPEQWCAQIYARILKKHKVILVTTYLDKETVEKANMIHASSPDEALRMAYEMKGKDAEVVVIPDGVSVLAVKE